MPIPKAAIAEALLQLDQKNDALWTDDGSPIVSEVQRLCNDDKITRQMINDASPGFARRMVSLDENTGQPLAAITPGAPDVAEDDDIFAEGEEPAREILARHVRDADLDLQEAKKVLSEAHRAVTNAERIHAKKLMLYNSKFPPITVAQNIKDHLARQQEILYERVTGQRANPAAVLQNPIDATMANRSRASVRRQQLSGR